MDSRKTSESGVCHLARLEDERTKETHVVFALDTLDLMQETAGFYAGVHALLDRAARCRSGDESSVALGALTNAARDYATAVLATNEATELFGSVHGERSPRERERERERASVSQSRTRPPAVLATQLTLCEESAFSAGADSVPGAKPLPDGLLVVAGELGLAPERCIYVGDSPSDGGAARAANFGASIGVSYGSHAIEKLASSGNFDVIVHSVAELEELLFGPVQADAAADYAQLCAATIDRPKVLA